MSSFRLSEVLTLMRDQSANPATELEREQESIEPGRFARKKMQFGGTCGNELVETHLPKSWTNHVIQWVKLIQSTVGIGE
jgi:hypothetical protein